MAAAGASAGPRRGSRSDTEGHGGHLQREVHEVLHPDDRLSTDEGGRATQPQRADGQDEEPTEHDDEARRPAHAPRDPRGVGAEQRSGDQGPGHVADGSGDGLLGEEGPQHAGQDPPEVGPAGPEDESQPYGEGDPREEHDDERQLGGHLLLGERSRAGPGGLGGRHDAHDHLGQDEERPDQPPRARRDPAGEELAGTGRQGVARQDDEQRREHDQDRAGKLDDARLHGEGDPREHERRDRRQERLGGPPVDGHQHEPHEKPEHGGGDDLRRRRHDSRREPAGEQHDPEHTRPPAQRRGRLRHHLEPVARGGGRHTALEGVDDLPGCADPVEPGDARRGPHHHHALRAGAQWGRQHQLLGQHE